MFNYIESPSNSKIKLLCRLIDSAKDRRQEGKFILEGLRLCFDCAFNSPIEAESVFFTDDAYTAHSEELSKIAAELPAFVISAAIAKKLARTKSSQGVFMLCKIPDFDGKLDFSGRYIAVENVQNPDNFGAICRCVEAMGLSGLIISGGVDMFNEKALRAAMGSSLRLNIVRTDNLIAGLEDMKANGAVVYAAVPDENAKKINEIEFSGGAVVVIGNEGNGVSDEVKAISIPLTIPMKGKAESLNAAAAAAIISWELAR